MCEEVIKRKATIFIFMACEPFRMFLTATNFPKLLEGFILLVNLSLKQ